MSDGLDLVVHSNELDIFRGEIVNLLDEAEPGVCVLAVHAFT